MDFRRVCCQRPMQMVNEDGAGWGGGFHAGSPASSSPSRRRTPARSLEKLQSNHQTTHHPPAPG
eukprot:scaffold293282_cov27-Tisochrysis_lutea.AAC.1